MRRMFFSWICMSLVAGSAGFVSADGAALPGDPVVVQPTAQPRVANSGTPSRPTVRRYRSYSIDPGVSRPAKQSYRRGDSKARGQFNR
jgi:hypothetical protein